MSQNSCKNCQKAFQITDEDIIFYNKMEVPPPTWCPRCRMKRRMNFWNMRLLFRKKEEKDGKEIFSVFPPDCHIKIYDREYWWTDNWDPMDYGKDYNFDISFFEQFKELMYNVPWPSRAASQLIASDYCNNANNLKDCYLCFDGNSSEKCLYCVGFAQLNDSIDVYQCASLELCYEMFASYKCYECFYSTGLKDCNGVWFSRDCVGCQNCFGCANLKNKQYHILNQPYSKEEYEKRINIQKLHSYKNFVYTAKQVHEFLKTQPRKYMHGIQNINVVGEYVSNSKNVEFSYMGSEMENVKYTQALGTRVKDSMDYTNWGEGAQQIYEVVNSGIGLNMIKFCDDVSEECSNLEYCMSIGNSSYLFGCVGLRKAQYCILNKQYDHESFNTLRTKIIKHMNEMPYFEQIRKPKSENLNKNEISNKVEYKYGEFFPPEFAPFAYNESTANDFYPLNEQEIIDFGSRYKEDSNKIFETTISAMNIDDDINDVKDNITKEVIECLDCKKAYRILDRELVFLKRYGIPAPRLCVDCRYKARLKHRNPLTWWVRECMCNGQESAKNKYMNENILGHKTHAENQKCPNTFKTSFPKESEAIVYCEFCYQAEIR